MQKPHGAVDENTEEATNEDAEKETEKIAQKDKEDDKEVDARDAQQRKMTMMNHKTEDDDNHMEASAEQEQVSHGASMRMHLLKRQSLIADMVLFKAQANLQAALTKADALGQNKMM